MMTLEDMLKQLNAIPKDGSVGFLDAATSAGFNAKADFRGMPLHGVPLVDVDLADFDMHGCDLRGCLVRYANNGALARNLEYAQLDDEDRAWLASMSSSTNAGTKYKLPVIDTRLVSHADVDKLLIAAKPLSESFADPRIDEMLRKMRLSFSLSPPEQVRIVASVRGLSPYQVDELIKVFDDEIAKFTILADNHAEDIVKLATQIVDFDPGRVADILVTCFGPQDNWPEALRTHVSDEAEFSGSISAIRISKAIKERHKPSHFRGRYPPKITSDMTPAQLTGAAIELAVLWGEPDAAADALDRLRTNHGIDNQLVDAIAATLSQLENSGLRHTAIQSIEQRIQSAAGADKASVLVQAASDYIVVGLADEARQCIAAATATGTRSAVDEGVRIYVEELGDHAAAEKLQLDFIAADPEDANRLVAFGKFLEAERADPRRAEFYFKDAIRLQPENWAAAAAWASWLVHHGGRARRTEALHIIRHICESLKGDGADKSASKIIEQMAIRLSELDQDAAAREILADLKRKAFDPSFAEALIEARAGNLAKADMLFATILRKPGLYYRDAANVAANHAYILFARRKDVAAREALRVAEERSQNGFIDSGIRLELAFYKWVHTGGDLQPLKALIVRGVRSPGWDLSRSVERAQSEKPRDAELVAAVADVIAGRKQVKFLNDFPAWRQT